MKESGEKPLRQFSPVHQGHSKDERKERLWDLLHRCPCYCRRCNYCHTGCSFVQTTRGPRAPARFSGNCNSSAPPPPPRCRSHPCCCAAWTRTLDSLWLFPGCQTSIHPVRASHCGNILVWNHSRVCTIYLIAAWKWGSCYFGFLSLSTRLHISKLLQCENCVLKKKQN